MGEGKRNSARLYFGNAGEVHCFFPHRKKNSGHHSQAAGGSVYGILPSYLVMKQCHGKM